MSIKNKKTGPLPTYKEPWKEIAKDTNRTTDAIWRCKGYYDISVVEAGAKVREFQRSIGVRS